MDKAIYTDCLRRLLSWLRSIDIGSRSRIHKSVLLVTAALLAIAMLLALSHWSTANTPAYRLAAVKRGSIVSTVTASGTLNPVTTVIVGSQLSGQIVEILAGYNDRVSSGQILARLNSDQIRRAHSTRWLHFKYSTSGYSVHFRRLHHIHIGGSSRVVRRS